MANVYITASVPFSSDFDYVRRMISQFHDLYESCQASRHHLVSCSDDADLIIVVSESGARQLRLRNSQLYRNRWSDIFLFESGDTALPFVQGIYPSIDSRMQAPYWTASMFYPIVCLDDSIGYDSNYNSCDLLFSFVGTARNHSSRKRIMELRDASAYLREPFNSDSLDQQSRKAAYVEIMRRSKFVLCPRGVGASSMRLFESMKIGRVPVIISDAWVAPAGPDWAQFSVRITEREIETIPRRLHELEPRYEAMGRAARVAWEQWFDRTVAFNTCVDYCLEIKRQQSVHKKIFQRMIVFKNSYGQLVRPFYFKYYFLKPLLRDLRVLALD